MCHDTTPKARGRKSKCSTQRVLKRKRCNGRRSQRKRDPSSSPSQTTCETMGTAVSKQSTSGRVSRNTSVDSKFPPGEEKGESGESSECGGESETSCTKLSRKRMRRRILPGSDSSDDDYENLKRHCEIKVCKVSLENIMSRTDTNKINHIAVPVTVHKEMGEANLEGVGRENISIINNEVNKLCSQEELAVTDQNLDIESEDEVERIISETTHVSPKRNTAGERSIKRNAKSANVKRKCNENNTRTLGGQRNNSNLQISYASKKCVVKSPTVDQSPLNTTDRLEEFGFKETRSKILRAHKEDNFKISENERNECPDYKMPNAKPSRIAHKGKDDCEQKLLPDDLELNLKKEHLSKLLKTNANARPLRKVKRPSLLKRIISTCERKSKIRTVEEKETKPTRRRRRNTRVRKVSEENETITNDGHKMNSNAENCKEMLPSSRLESSSLNGDTDSCETPMLPECHKSESTTQRNESSVCNFDDECSTQSNVGDSKVDLQSVRRESSLCNDNDGSRTPTFAEYYETKLQLSREFLACNDDANGCRTPTFSEYYKMNVSSQKANFSESNNINKSKTFTKEDGDKLEMQSARHSPEHNKNFGNSIEPCNSKLQSPGIQPPEYNGDIDGRVTPTLSDYYSENLLPFPLEKASGCNSNTSDGSRLDVNTGVVENPLDFVASTPRVGSLQTPSKIKSLAQLSRQVSPNSAGHQVISTNVKPVAVEEGITLTNHSDRCGDSAVYSSPIKTEPIKVEHDCDIIAESDTSEDDGWHFKVTPFVKSYGKNRSGTLLPIKKEVGLMQSCNRELLETNSSTTDVTNVGESAAEDTISVDAVANDSDSSAGTSGDAKEVVNHNIIETSLAMPNPLDSLVSPVLKSRHCAAMVVSKPLFSSSPMVKPSRSLNLTLPKPICSVIAPYNSYFPAAEVPKILQSTSTEKPKTVDDAGAEIPKSLQDASIKEPNVVHNGTAELPKRFQRARRKELRSLRNTATEVVNVVTQPCAPKATCSAVEMPGPAGKKCRRSSNAAANLRKQAGCEDNEAVSMCVSLQDSWKNYRVRFQCRDRQDHNLKNGKLNYMESYGDKILTSYLQKEVSQANVDAAIYSLINCTRGMNSSILAMCIIRATMEYISTQYEALQSGMPELSGTEHHLLALVFKLTSVTNFVDVKDHILSYISYGMFRLCRTPQASVLCALSRFYVLLCLRYGQYNHILMLCCDALFALSYGAFPVIHAALLLYDKTLLKAHFGKEHPLCLVISHVLLSQQNSNGSPLFKVECVKNLVCRKFGYRRGEFMFRDVLKKLSDWLREGRLNYIERAFLILAKKEQWYVIHKEVVQKQLMVMVTAWQDKRLSDRVVLVVIRLLGYIPRSFPRGPKTFGPVSEVLKTLSSLLGRPGNFAQLEETVITAVMALGNHCFRQVFNVVYSWKPLRPVPDTFFDVLFSMRNFKDWPSLLTEAKSSPLFGEVTPVPLVAETKP